MISKERFAERTREALENKIGVGVCLLITNKKRLLVAERINKFGHGCLACPGGHQEKNETWAQTALRELKEEAGGSIKVKLWTNFPDRMESESHVPLFVTNNVLPNGKHYVTIWLASRLVSGEAENKEPHKKKEWMWMTLDEITNDPRLKDGLTAWLIGKFHESLHWMPLPELHRFRDDLGL